MRTTGRLRRRAWMLGPFLLACALGLQGLLVPALRPALAQEAATPAAIVFGPYVNGVSATGARVHWVTPAGAAATCELIGGPAGAPVEVKTTPLTGLPEVRRTALLSGLPPGRPVRYAVTGGGTRVEGTFRTSPEAGSREAFTFLSCSDTQTSASRRQAVAAAMMRESDPAFTILTGDLVDDGPDWDLWTTGFQGLSDALMRRGTLWTVRGNHEADGVLYKELFRMPGETGTYSFDYANLHVVMLDQYRERSREDLDAAGMAALAAWLERDLSGTKAEWKIACFHQPMFNVSGHASSWGRREILPILEKHGVDIVLTGHSHVHERYIPVGPTGGKPVIHLVSPPAGGYPRELIPSPIMAVNRQGSGYYAFSIEGNRLELLAKAVDGSVFDRLELVKSGGRYQDEVMAAAVPTADAAQLVGSFSYLSADVPARPRGGEGVIVSLRPGSFPPGAAVRIAPDPQGAWTVRPVSFTESESPVAVAAVPPAGVLLGEGRLFSPSLTVSVDIEHAGRKYACPSVPLLLTYDTIRKLVPPPEPVPLAAARAAFRIDGDLADWAGVPYLRLPSTGADSKAFRLAWRPEGLYGAAHVARKEIRSDPEKPWESDGLELYVEGDAQRRIRASSEGTPVKFYLMPPADGTGGRLRARRAYGRLPKEPVEAVWTRTTDGYAVEFRIPTANIAGVPALPAGRKMGFHFVLRAGGEVLEQFSDTAAFRSVGSSPVYWGQLRLADR